jgi:hypothetical protein
MNEPDVHADPFAHLKQQASERSDRTVERTKAGIAALRADRRKITAESLKQATRELEPGFAGLSFQVIRRNPRAYALYREAADAFSEQAVADKQPHVKRRRRCRGDSSRTPRSSYDPLQRFDKKNSCSAFAHWRENSTPNARDAVHSPTTSKYYWQR